MKSETGDWISRPLGELIVPKNDKAKQVKSTDYSPVGAFPIVDQSSQFICGFHDDEKKLIRKDLPLTVFGDHTRHTKFITFPFLAGADGTQLLRPKGGLDDRFFFYMVSWAAGKIGNYGYDRHFKHLKEFSCDYPEGKSEQTKIAEILSTVDRAIEQTEALIAKQQRIKTGLMQDLLTRGIDEHGNLRSEETHQFKDSPLGRIPVEWEAKKLGNSCDVCNSLRKPIAALVRETMKGDYPYYGPTGTLDYIDEYRVDGRFVLIGEDGDHFLKFNTQEMTQLVEGKYNVNNHAHILRGKGSVLTEWVHLYFLHRDITLYLTRQGAGRFKLNKAALLELPLIVPKEPQEQVRILEVMITLRRNQGNSVENLNKLKSQKDALMQDLLTGRRSVVSLLKAEDLV